MNNKIKEFERRNKKRNAALYAPDKVLNQDYVVCPITNARMLIIRADYIEKVLGMTVAEYNSRFPNIQRKSLALSKNISAGLQKIDAATGLTKYEAGQIKARAILKEVDENGKSGYKRKGEKTRATHMNKVDGLGRHGYQRQAHKRLTTILENGLTIEQNAHIKQKEKLIANFKSGHHGASKISKKVLKPIVDFLSENNIKYYFDKFEYGMRDPITKNFYFWDLVIPEYNMAIEYQSNAWHADPRLTESRWHAWRTPKGERKSANQVLAYDYQKARALFINRKLVTYYVWESSQDIDVKEILCLLKTQNTK